ncbi:pentapeptide repeat-containing protein [Streptosporangium canum]|uniref:pentapeptide repeat-containing protein n=1 Tax=Streptosporangium canum TaxID=324952 RepID=UPI0036CA026A
MVLVGGAVASTLWWLLADLSTAPPAPPGSAVPPPATAGAAASARGESLRTALAAGAGVGAAITLALAFRRQHHQERAAAVTADLAERNALLAERVAEHTQHDATERRVTDLYVKAAEQLGHAQAAVRLAGLYALERLAQDNPDHRQTIVNVICAYLRMPHTPPPLADDPKQVREARPHQAMRTTGTSAPLLALEAAEDLEGERQVRLTAQRILGEHLRDERPADEHDTTPPGPRHWPGIRIDLTGATLIDLDLTRCHAATFTFAKATFIGDAVFEGATFLGDAGFDEAIFIGKATFYKATFTGDARFDNATFTGNARFDNATFTEDACFNWATFGNAGFHSAIFSGDAWFAKTTFTGGAWFTKTTFAGDASFVTAALAGDASFVTATFAGENWFDEVTFSRNARFDEATFASGAWFEAAIVEVPDGNHFWPAGWRVVTRADGSGKLVREGKE